MTAGADCSLVTDVTGGEGRPRLTGPRLRDYVFPDSGRGLRLSLPTLWLCSPGMAPRPLASSPFDPAKFNRPEDQTQRLLREARQIAAARAGRAVGGGGRARGAESDLQSAWEERAAMNAGRGPASWAHPAQALGLTQAAAQRIYSRTPAEARNLYRSGEPGRPGIGRRDSWDVWFAAPRDVAHAWAPHPTRPASAPLHTDRTASRIERLRAQVQAAQS